MKILVLFHALVASFILQRCEAPGEPRDASLDGLGKACKTDADCAPAQKCHAFTHPECPDSKCQQCQIPCTGDAECPAGSRCNLPPILPGSLPFVCVVTSD